MKYKGVELKPITEVQAFSEPREMLVWDNKRANPKLRMVYAIVGSGIAISNDGCFWLYCAEIPEKKKRERTALEVMEYLHEKQVLLDKGNGGVVVARYKPEKKEANYFYYGNLTLTAVNGKVFYGILKNGKVTEFELPEIE